MKRDFLALTDFSPEEIREVLDRAKAIKNDRKKGKDAPQVLKNRTAALIFHKPSLRTRASFEVGVRELGGSAVYITDKEISIGKRESVYDVAQVMSRYFGLICIRTFAHDTVVELAEHSTVPVVNMLTDLLHPCQVISDLLTIFEHFGKFEDLKIAYMGDGNNLANSWLKASGRIKMDLRIGTSPETMPDPEMVREAQSAGISRITITHDPVEAVESADVIYGDVWASMGEKHLEEEKKNLLKDFQINTRLLSHADSGAIVMHCLPANRGQEITDEVMDGPQSVIFDQAENRLHAQKAVLVKLFEG